MIGQTCQVQIYTILPPSSTENDFHSSFATRCNLRVQAGSIASQSEEGKSTHTEDKSRSLYFISKNVLDGKVLVNPGGTAGREVAGYTQICGVVALVESAKLEEASTVKPIDLPGDCGQEPALASRQPCLVQSPPSSLFILAVRRSG